MQGFFFLSICQPLKGFLSYPGTTECGCPPNWKGGVGGILRTMGPGSLVKVRFSTDPFTLGTGIQGLRFVRRGSPAQRRQ